MCLMCVQQGVPPAHPKTTKDSECELCGGKTTSPHSWFPPADKLCGSCHDEVLMYGLEQTRWKKKIQAGGFSPA